MPMPIIRLGAESRSAPANDSRVTLEIPARSASARLASYCASNVGSSPSDAIVRIAASASDATPPALAYASCIFFVVVCCVVVISTPAPTTIGDVTRITRPTSHRQ